MLKKVKSDKSTGYGREPLRICSLVRQAKRAILAWYFGTIVDEDIQGAPGDLCNFFRCKLSQDLETTAQSSFKSRTFSVSGLSKSPDTMDTFLLDSASCFRSVDPSTLRTRAKTRLFALAYKGERIYMSSWFKPEYPSDCIPPRS